MTRECSGCSLCCRLLPVLEIGKKAAQRCHNQKLRKGCLVHGTPAQPMTCRIWSCHWLRSDIDLPRPDRSGYVIDPTMDVVVLGEDAFTGRRVPALQIWADASRGTPWRNLALRCWLEAEIGAREMVVVVRLNENDAITMLPPHLSETGEWAEIGSRIMKPLTAIEVKKAERKARFEAAREKYDRNINGFQEPTKNKTEGAMQDVQETVPGQELDPVPLLHDANLDAGIEASLENPQKDG